MQASCEFEVAASVDVVFAYLTDPRNLVVANHRKPIIEQADHLLVRTGSWFVLALDQLRVRLEYTTVQPPESIRVDVSMCGTGARGQRDRAVYPLSPIDGGTRVALAMESEGGWTPAPLGQLLWPLVWRGIGRRMATNIVRRR